MSVHKSTSHRKLPNASGREKDNSFFVSEIGLMERFANVGATRRTHSRANPLLRMDATTHPAAAPSSPNPRRQSTTASRRFASG